MFSDEVICKFRDINFSLSQWGKNHRKYVQPVIQIFPECTLFGLPFQRSFWSGNNTNVNINRLPAANGIYLSFLQDPQQLSLKRQAHLSNLIEKYRAGVGLDKFTISFTDSACKCPLFMTKQFAFKKSVGYCCTIYRHKRALCPVAPVMNKPCKHLFPGAALTLYQHRHITECYLTRCLQQPEHPRVYCYNPCCTSFFSRRFIFSM